MAQDYEEWIPPGYHRMRQKVIDRMVRAIETGERCIVTVNTHPGHPLLNNPVVKRRVDALSPSGFSLLDAHGLWPEAMKRIAKIRRPHPKALIKTQRVWHLYNWSLRRLVRNDDALIAGLKVLLPRYNGPPLTLYRGQGYGQQIGLSWTHNYEVARKFALYGMGWADLDLKKIPRRVRNKPRRGAIILKATMKREIISQEICLRGNFRYGEHVIDPRGVEDLPNYRVEELDDSGHNKYWCNCEIMPDGSERPYPPHPSFEDDEDDEDDEWT
jgi:hypothetical protein